MSIILVSTIKYRKVTQNQHALFLQHVSADEFINPQRTENTQEEFDYFHKVALGLLDRFYPERTTTVGLRSRDPDYITPHSCEERTD